jgi:N-acetylglucosaminyl-diphospho-decaprenol L-rhamnosyltransferase
MTDTPLDIVIVTFNSAEVLGGLLDSLATALEHVPNAQVFVADNDSKDASLRIASGHPVVTSVLEVGYNAGYSAGINAAVHKFGRGGALLLLNADIRLEPDCIEKMLAELDDPRAGIVVPRMLHEDGTLSHSIRREPSLVTAWSEAVIGGNLAGSLGVGEVLRKPEDYTQSRNIEAATGAILLVSAAARKAVGDWDERYFLYSEEVDYQRRVRQAGFDIRYAPDALCTHIGGESNENPTLFSLLTANRVRYYRRYHSAGETLLFRLAVTVGAGLRYVLGPTHRAELRAAWMPTTELARLIPSQRAALALLKEP